MRNQTVFTSVAFRNFKALEDFSLKLQHTNVLVGPNNAGKSTVISAFRALSAAIRSARVRAPEFVIGPGGESVIGYRIPERSLPMSTENVHTDYADTETSITFRLSNANRLRLFFPADGGCVLLPEVEGKIPRTAAAFKQAFPVSVGVVPILGPVERGEKVLDSATVQRDLTTHRASRQFRNFWFQNRTEGEFEEFSARVRQTWPGMDIQRPEFNAESSELEMFAAENRMDRELFWVGSGFQIWCQLLTHIQRARSDTILVIDEPEIYLHPDVQRQLLGILQQAGPDLLLATHSTEIIGEADPTEILVVDKTRKKAVRITSGKGLQEVFDLLGSGQNITLSRLARNKRLVFVEGLNDFRILRRFARKLNLAELASGADLTAVESGGFSSNEQIRGLAWGFEKILETRLRLAAIFDRDFWSEEELRRIHADLAEILDLAHIHSRKEIENYLLVPSVLERTFRKGLEDRARRRQEAVPAAEPMVDILKRVTSAFHTSCQAQYVAKRVEYLDRRRRGGLGQSTDSVARGRNDDQATITQQSLEWFESKWNDIETRMEIVHGKDVLAALRTEVKERYSVSLTDNQIIEEFTSEEIPADLRLLLLRLEDFRNLPEPPREI